MKIKVQKTYYEIIDIDENNNILQLQDEDGNIFYSYGDINVVSYQPLNPSKWYSKWMSLKDEYKWDRKNMLNSIYEPECNLKIKYIDNLWFAFENNEKMIFC